MRVLVLVLSLVATASAGIPQPQVSIGLNVGEEATGNLGGLEPKVKWQNSGTFAGCDVEGGVDLTMSAVDENPTTFLWGKIKKTIQGFGDVSIRGDVDAYDNEIVDLEVRANGFETGVQILGQADTKSKTVSVSKVQVTKGFDALGGSLVVNPKYDLDKSSPDVRVGYSMDNTSFQVDAQQKKLTISHCFDNNDQITPTVTTNGDFSLSYSRDVKGGKLTTSYTPKDSIKLQWNDGDWATTVKAPLDGFYKANQGITINMRRSIDVM